MSDTETIEKTDEKKERKPPEHGTRARYGWKQNPCRCDLCKAANAKWQADYRDSKKAGRKRHRRVAIHGTRAKYVAGCKCKECTEANRTYQRKMSKLYRANGGNAAGLLPDNLSDLD